MKKTALILILLILSVTSLQMRNRQKQKKGQKHRPGKKRAHRRNPPKAADQPAPAKTEKQQFNARFTDNGDGTILDKNTGLIWMKDANISTMPLPYDGARQYLQDMNSGKRPNFGFSDWRLPTINEMETLVEKTRFYPALPVGHPFSNVQNHLYWSTSRGRDVVDYLWIMDLASGEMVMDYLSSCSYKFLWPVRSSWMPTTAKASTVMTGGLNEYGQLGDGSTTDREAFLPVSGLENVVKVSAGLEHAVALKSDGSIWTWGRNNYGQLGNGTHGRQPDARRSEGPAQSNRCRGRHVPHGSAGFGRHRLDLGQEFLWPARKRRQ